MSPEIMKRYIRLRTTHEIWTALPKLSMMEDESQLFALNQRAFSTKLVGRPLSTYYEDLIENFQELDHRDNIKMKDPDDVSAFKKSGLRGCQRVELESSDRFLVSSSSIVGVSSRARRAYTDRARARARDLCNELELELELSLSSLTRVVRRRNNGKRGRAQADGD
ncbi:hypothetical protein Sango_1191000 [Sesamum angolense]|uniref:Uncharacterized protein n=1 Tax=Sesamum angolense TaxID=2727404 RepID=A0AAE2BX07_9LAMI|nr:hypothetical protein Sango_1191000 [Sesamum angolense]